MKIRLMGTESECTWAVERLKRAGIRIRAVSEFYRNRGPSIEGRVYVEVDL